MYRGATGGRFNRKSTAVQGAISALQLQRLQVIDQQMERLNGMIAAAMKPASRLRDSTWQKYLVWEWIRRNKSFAEVRCSGQYLRIGSGVNVVGGNLSRQRGKGGAEPQQSLRER